MAAATSVLTPKETLLNTSSHDVEVNNVTKPTKEDADASTVSKPTTKGDADASTVSNTDATTEISNSDSADSEATEANVETMLLESSSPHLESTPTMELTADNNVILCCVPKSSLCDEDQQQNFSSKSPVAYQNADDLAAELPIADESNMITYWTEATRRRFELGIESLLSTVDSTGTRNNATASTDEADPVAISAAFENKYRSMVQDGLTNLVEKEEKMQHSNARQSSNRVDGANGRSDSEAKQDRLTAARRLFSPKERSARLRRMRRKMSHSERDVKESTASKSNKSNAKALNKKSGISVSRYDDLRGKAAHSFDEQYLRRQSPKHDVAEDAEWSAFTESSSNSGSILSKYFHRACACGDTARLEPVDEENDIVISSMMKDNALFVNDDDELHAYDSDPELFHTVSSSSLGINLRGSIKTDEKEQVEHEKDVGNKFETPRSVDILDDEATAKLINEITHDTMTLVLHRVTDPSQSARTSAPSKQKMWIELGSRVKGDIVQPKLVWRNAHQEKPVEQSQASSSAGVDILDISRVRSLSETEKRNYPLAKKSRSFAIVTSDKLTYIFEAKNAEEKSRIVQSLKLLVARLASLIIVGDDALFTHFFYPESSADFHRQYGLGVKYDRQSSTSTTSFDSDDKESNS